MEQPDDRFTVQFERSGGLAGASVRASVDSDQLAEPDASQLRDLLDRVDFGATSPPPKGADRFQYDITVRRAGQSRSLTTYDGSMPQAVKALSDWLVSYARRQRPAN